MVLQRNKTSIFDGGRSWWVIFKDPECRILTPILKTGFGHCLVFTRMHNITMMIEPHLGVVNHVLTDADLSELLAEQKIAGNTVVHFRHEANAKSFVFRPPLVNCASYIAYTMGISFFGITPYQLYKKIIRMGGEEI